MSVHATKKQLIQRLLVVGLMLTSFVMLFLPWVRISLGVFGRLASVPGYVSDVADYAEYFGFDLRGVLYDAIDAVGARELLDAASENGMYQAVEGLLSGSLTPLETARLGDLLGRGFGSLRRVEMGGTANIALLGLAEVGEKMASASGAIRAGLWIMCALLALSVVLVLCGRRLGALPYFIGAAGMLIVFASLVHGFNSGIQSIVNNYSYLFADELGRLGISIAAFFGLRIFHIGPAAVVCLLFAAAAFVLMLLRFRENESVSSRRAAPAPVYAVPVQPAAAPVRSAAIPARVSPPQPVGFYPPQPAAAAPRSRISASFCTRCGRERSPGAAFCTGCGMRLI